MSRLPEMYTQLELWEESPRISKKNTTPKEIYDTLIRGSLSVEKAAEKIGVPVSKLLEMSLRDEALSFETSTGEILFPGYQIVGSKERGWRILEGIPDAIRAHRKGGVQPEANVLIAIRLTVARREFGNMSTANYLKHGGDPVHAAKVLEADHKV